MGVTFSAEEAAELADIKPALLRLWLETGKFKTDNFAISHPNAPKILQTTTYFFTEADIPRLIEFAASQGKRKPTKTDPFVDDGTRENFTVSEIATMWRLSPDTVQRLFQDEPDVITLGNKNPRAKQKRVTLRIPRAVMERVKKRRSNQG
jgi:hypothetical protein